MQIDLLRKHAAHDKAYAIYALYSDCIRTNKDIDLEFCNDTLTNICTNCRNGIFLISADKIYKDFIIPGKKVIYREEIVNHSLPASILDLFISEVHHYYDDMDDHIKHSYKDLKVKKFERLTRKSAQLIRFEQENIYTYKDFPSYLKALIRESDSKRESGRIEKRVRDNCWEEFASIESTNLSAVGIIDMRSKNVLMNNSNGELFFTKE